MLSVSAYAEHTAPVYDVDSMSSDSQAASAGAPNALTPQDNSRSAANGSAVDAPLTSSEPPASVEQRIERVEQQLENVQQNDISNRLNSMQGEVQALRGQVEELNHQLQDLRNQQNATHAELGKDVSSASPEQAMSQLPREADEDPSTNIAKPVHAKNVTKPGVSASPLADAKLDKQALKSSAKLAAERSSKKALFSSTKGISANEQPNGAEEQAVYQTAYNLIKVKKYNEAITNLQKMLVKYPSGQTAANAHYWLGELYSLTGENEQAANEFNTVVKLYPSNPRVADAELKLGLINATLLKWPAAKVSFKKVISKYPGSASARLAMEQLRLLKQAGH